ncbi:heavy-metal-associated domain-containing protein [Nesterenkonia populi]|uniref:heavy-metal-associated domain-containing protein n=1 Tax=Nesterenkonia populi TaxID=1591087 RepID=UPI0011BF071E|nr:heavy-metal-associated domain-containing protein [Nesterenkonia populi]
MAATAEFQVTGMSCGHCERAVRTELSEIDGVTSIEVSARTGRLAVTAEQSVDDAAVITAVDEAGYTAVRS